MYNILKLNWSSVIRDTNLSTVKAVKMNFSTTLTVRVILFVSINITFIYGTPCSCEEQELDFVSREAWGARPPKGTEPMNTPVNHVVIHHTFIPGACTTHEACEKSMKGMQNFHVDTRQWMDIGYSFLVGGDNRVYVGRGWNKVGAHAKKYNRDSIGIAIIGNWTTTLPPAAQMDIVKSLIAFGVQSGKIIEDYKLVGHREGANTECPGDALFAEIQKWPHWLSTAKNN